MKGNVIGRLLLPLQKCLCQDTGPQCTKLICRCGIVDLEVIILDYSWKSDLVTQTLEGRAFSLSDCSMLDQEGISQRFQM
jgi:hypothetical protein